MLLPVKLKLRHLQQAALVLPTLGLGSDRKLRISYCPFM